ncbi:PREDICTED: CMRF35-like molecule 4 isoform X1 [Chinchilla lanigera]|uniref:CMRF35-like molecule 4 isoform X1 n=1 Tax=Chinchilla lanigera TaxID=34839 RepID=UPI00038EC7D5|nr:PREDICTED: CMRF35-like molecule 4 isoform X1 [Chinchilla lanigera]
MTPWLFPALLLLLLPGFSAAQKDITGPNAVSGQERGSLTVQCRYTSKWKTSRKWWCRGAAWSSCKIQIQTDGSEKEQKKERLSIRDYQKELVFRVTLEDLRRDDADSYWCGFERLGTDPGLKVKVTVVPDLHEESLSSVRPSPTLAPSTTKTIKYQLVTTTSNSTQLETGTSAPTREGSMKPAPAHISWTHMTEDEIRHCICSIVNITLPVKISLFEKLDCCSHFGVNEK